MWSSKQSLTFVIYPSFVVNFFALNEKNFIKPRVASRFTQSRSYTRPKQFVKFNNPVRFGFGASWTVSGMVQWQEKTQHEEKLLLGDSYALQNTLQNQNWNIWLRIRSSYIFTLLIWPRNRFNLKLVCLFSFFCLKRDALQYNASEC